MAAGNGGHFVSLFVYAEWHLISEHFNGMSPYGIREI